MFGPIKTVFLTFMLNYLFKVTNLTSDFDLKMKHESCCFFLISGIAYYTEDILHVHKVWHLCFDSFWRYDFLKSFFKVIVNVLNRTLSDKKNSIPEA
jgi:hypothetical protein